MPTPHTQMDEIQRSKALLASILSRTASIKLTTNDLSDRLDTLKVKAEEAQIEGPSQEDICPLYQLPYDCLREVLHPLSARDLAALSRTCRYLRDFISTDESLWTAKLRDEYSITSNVSSDADLATLFNEETLAHIKVKMEQLYELESESDSDVSGDEHFDLPPLEKSPSPFQSPTKAQTLPGVPLNRRHMYNALSRLLAFSLKHMAALQAAKRKQASRLISYLSPL